MNITIITPTADQPTGIKLLEGYVARQTVQPDQWVVADDGDIKATLTMGQDHITRHRTAEGGGSLALNLLAGLEAVAGDYVVIMEHDDWYAPNHIETCIAHQVYGARHTRYYHVGMRCYITLRNRGSSLCCTAFGSGYIPLMARSAESCLATGSISIDGTFWRQVGQPTVEGATFVGIKGLPGRRGLGMGHKPKGWAQDKDKSVLREWIGNDADNY